jgi:acyl-CoA synthetase (NDP forming)
LNHQEKPKNSEVHILHKILNPKSICVFGANNNPITTMGSMQLRNIIAGGALNSQIYPIHPKLENVQGFKAYKSVLDLPITPELAFIILPPNAVPQVMEECGQKGIKFLIITSGGFRESGQEGKVLSKKIDEIAKKYGMRFIGPNCLGVFNNWANYGEKQDAYFNTCWPYLAPERGNISIISQSGTIAAQIFWHAKNMGVKICKSISVGNEKNIDIVDFLDYFKNDPQTEVIGLYIEEVKRGKEFLELVKEITPKKPIVAIYAGGTKASDRSINSHTGSIGGNDKIFNAVFKETGIISTNSIMDFLHYLRILSQAQIYNSFPKGKRIGIITDSGGAGSMMAKAVETYGLEVPEFSEKLKSEIRKYIPATASSNNPLDVTFDVNFMNLFYYFPKILMNSGEIDAIIVYGVFDFDEILEVIEKSGLKVDEKVKRSSNIIESGVLKPIKRLIKKSSVITCYCGPFPYKYKWNQKFIEYDIPIFSMWDNVTKCLKILFEYSKYKHKFTQ